MIGGNMKRKFVWMAAAAGLCAALVACGGGGGSSSTSTTNNGGTNTAGTNTPATTTTTTSTLAPPFADATAVPVSSNATNAVPILVSAAFGSNSIRNFPMVSVTVCTANTNAATNCSTIPNVLLDTGSFGLRLFASAFPSAGAVTALGGVNVGGGTAAECAGFGSGDTWGTVRAADVKMSGEIAQNVSIQVIADNANLSATMPTACTTGKSIATVSQLGANGILGIGNALNDCGSACATQALTGAYYSCTGMTCTSVAVPTAQQVANPVALFPTDNNGVIVEMAQVADTGASTGTGTLVFGIDTQSNNALAGMSATILPTNNFGNVTAVFNGRTFANGAFMDTGSNGLFFTDSSLPTTTNGFFTPASATGLTATLVAANSATALVQFNVGNANTLFSSGNFAFNNLAATGAGFDLGIPFYYGRHVYHGIVGKSSTGGGTGPYVAYTSS